MTQETERRLAAIMVADVAGFSRLMEHAESETFARVRRLHDDVTQPTLASHGGRLIKTTGDGFLAEFASATAALRCAIALQRAVIAREAQGHAAERIHLRIGINVGDIIVDGTDVAGDGVNVAARLEPLAPRDGICISGTVRDQIREDLGVTLADLGQQHLKNIERSIHAFAITLDPVLTAAAPRAGPTMSENVAAGAAGAAGSAGRGATPSMAIPAATPSIAVLPFADLSAEKDQEYFTDGLAEELLNVLAKIRGLRVASRTSAFWFKGKDVDIPTVAAKLNVATVLEGSVRKSGQRVRITAQLIEVSSDSHLWSQTYDRTLEDIFAVQDDIAHAVVEELRGPLLGEGTGAAASAAIAAEVKGASVGRAEDSEAYRLYLQGRFYTRRATQGDVARGIEFQRRAIELDPRFALGWAGLAYAYEVQAGYGWRPYAEGFEDARAAAMRALELAPALAEAHLELAGVLRSHGWDFPAARAAFARALALAPGSAEVVRGAALMAACDGRANEALSLSTRALALDPLNPACHVSLAERHLEAGNYDAAAAECLASLELDASRGFAHYGLAKVRLLQGRAAEALAEAAREPIDAFRVQMTALAQHTLGEAEASDAALRELVDRYGTDASFQIAEVHAWRGEHDAAFDWLERGYAARDPGMTEMLPDPLLRALHADPRWQALIAKMRFT